MSPNLYQRLTAITSEVGGIKPTGKTAQREPAMSITDVEDALSPLLVKHGVVTGYSFNNAPVQADKQGNMTLWAVDLNVWLVNAENPDDRREDRACDVGSSPSAAVSFCLKRYFRALFHLSEPDEDENRKTAVQTSRSSSTGEARSETAASEPQTFSAPASAASAGAAPGRSSERAMALQRLTLAMVGSGLSKDDLKVRAFTMFGKEKADDMTTEQLDALAAEVEGLKQSTHAGVVR